MLNTRNDRRSGSGLEIDGTKGSPSTGDVRIPGSDK